MHTCRSPRNDMLFMLQWRNEDTARGSMHAQDVAIESVTMVLEPVHRDSDKSAIVLIGATFESVHVLILIVPLTVGLPTGFVLEGGKVLAIGLSFEISVLPQVEFQNFPLQNRQ